MQPLERFRHREVFEADYKIDLEKYCAETGQPLAGADFQVWESFDHSQINEHGYEEGSRTERQVRFTVTVCPRNRKKNGCVT